MHSRAKIAVDDDFRSYRRLRNQVLPLVMPGGLEQISILQPVRIS
jgi:hypothetical protein